MQGMITERDFLQIEQSFPGLYCFYQGLKTKPTTFLELVWLFRGRDPAEKQLGIVV